MPFWQLDMLLTDDLKNQLKEHALLELPNECCGVFLEKDNKITYLKIENKSLNPAESFAISYDQMKIINQDKIIGFFHSHTEGSFSDPDKQISEKRNLLAVIYKVKEDEFEIFKPEGRELPLVGRSYVMGIFDCFTLVQDYFERKFNIIISDFNHDLRFASSEEEIVESDYYKEGNETFINHFLSNGFVKINGLKEHDIILTRYGKIKCAVHPMIYVGNNRILRHTSDNLSDYETYSSYLKKTTVCCLRHRSFV